MFKPGIPSSSELVKEMLAYYPRGNKELVVKAYELCQTLHKNQFRKSGEPYWTHPVSVAQKIIRMKLDDKAIIAALLHDTIEDTGFESREIKDIFGKEVANLVEGLTKIDRLTLSVQDDRESATIKKLIIALSEDVRVLCIKLCDREHNMETISYMPAEKQLRKARETIDIFAPLAASLGIYDIKERLEDMSFRVINEKAWEAINKAVTGIKKRFTDAIGGEDIIGITVLNLRNIMLNNRMENFHILGREKSIYSIWRKMQMKEDNSLDQLKDFIAFRIICQNITECYKALGIMHSNFHAIPMSFKDYISTPKNNGYKSIHTVVLGLYGQQIEIQIRTKDMDFEAENGMASHWIYKEGTNPHKINLSHYQGLKTTLDNALNENQKGEFLSVMKSEMSKKLIYVFTEKGDLVTLQSGATVLDFSIAAYGRDGLSLFAAFINGKRVKGLGHKLKNGDQINIVSSGHSRVSKGWIKYCNSQYSIDLINGILSEIKLELESQKGKKLIDEMMDRYMVKNQNSFIKDSIEDGESKDEFYRKVAKEGSKGETLSRIKDKLYKVKSNSSGMRLEYFPLIKPRAKTLPDFVGRLNNMDDNVAKSLACCCQPKEGDDIVGHVINNHGVVIHNINCDIVNGLVGAGNTIVSLTFSSEA